MRWGRVIIYRTVRVGSQSYSIGECEMATIGLWLTALFFLWYGLRAFVPMLATDMFKKVGAVLAILVGIGTLLTALGIGM